MNKPNIALLCGGESSECKVSIDSSLNVINYIDREKFNPYLVFVGKKEWYAILPPCDEMGNYSDNQNLTSDQILGSIPHEEVPYKNVKRANLAVAHVDMTTFSITQNGETIHFDKALIMIHGTPGENGLVQGYLELKKIPYSSCSSYVSAITFDKHACKRFLDFAGVKMAKDIFIRKEGNFSKREIIRQIGFPMFIKPTVGGSSFGVTKVKCEENIDIALDNAFSECDTILAEEAISGREMTCGVFKLHDVITKLPVTEIVTKREFFDYQAKYLGESDEICPAPISEQLSAKIQNLSEHIYKYMGCEGIIRIDYIVTPEEDIYFLEVNTIPGMTKMSLIPKMLRIANIDLKELLTQFLENK